MKYIIVILSLSFLLTNCSKEETCGTCTYITESNQREAELSCQGLANNYPNGYIELTSVTINECDANNVDFPVGTISTGQVCAGTTFSLRARLDCN